MSYWPGWLHPNPSWGLFLQAHPVLMIAIRMSTIFHGRMFNFCLTLEGTALIDFPSFGSKTWDE